MAENKVTTRFETIGAQVAADDASRVSEATDKLQHQTGEAVDATDAAAKSTETLAGSQEALRAGLAALSPELAGLYEVLRQSVPASTSAAQGQKAIAEGAGAATTAVAANTAALTSLATSAGIVGGLMLIAKLYEEIKTKIQAATKAQEEFNEAQSRQASERLEREEALADALQQQGKGTDENLDEAKRLEAQLRRKGFEDVSVDVAAWAAGRGLSTAEVMAAASAAEQRDSSGRPLLDLSDPNAEQQLRLLMQHPRTAAQLQQGITFRGGAAPRLAGKALKELESYQYTHDEFGRPHELYDVDSRAAIEKWLGEQGYEPGEEMDRLIAYMQRLISAREEGEESPYADWPEMATEGKDPERKPFWLPDPARAKALREADALLRQLHTQSGDPLPPQSSVQTSQPTYHIGTVINYNTRGTPVNAVTQRDLSGEM